MREAIHEEKQQKNGQQYLEISNLGLFLNQRKIEEMCRQTFSIIQKQNVKEGQKAKEFKAGGFSNRIQLNYDAGVFFIQKYCEEIEDVNKEQELIKILSQQGITLPLIERKVESIDKQLIEQVAGIQSLSEIRETISQVFKERAFIPFMKCLIIQLFDKLRIMHEKAGVAHSDIKPGNIVMGFDRQFYFIDFGAATYITEEESLNNYFLCFTPSFNTKYFLHRFKQNKQIQKKDAIDCDNSQLALTLLALFASCLPSGLKKSFNEMEEEDFTILISDIYLRFKDEEEEQRYDLIRIFIFLFSKILDPNKKFLDVEKFVFSAVDNTSQNYSQIVKSIDPDQIESFQLFLKSSFPLDDVIQFYSKIEDIEFIPNKREIIIKKITFNNIRFIELLQNIGHCVKCDNYLQIQYDLLLEYQIIMQKAKEKLFQLNQKDDSQVEIFFIEKIKQYFIIHGQFKNKKNKISKQVIINQGLEFNQDFEPINLYQFYTQLSRFLEQSINNFNEKLNVIKQSFQSDEKMNFKDMYNYWLIQKPKEIKITNREALLSDKQLEYLDNIVKYNENLQKLSINAVNLKKQDYQMLGRILQTFCKKQGKHLILNNISFCDHSFQEQVIENEWEYFHFSSHQIISDQDYENLFIPQKGFRSKRIKIELGQKQPEILDKVCSEILIKCGKVEQVELNFFNNTIQLQDQSFGFLFKNDRISNKLKQLTIILQKDENPELVLNEQLLNYLYKNKFIEYFELKIFKCQSNNFSQVKKQINQINQIKEKMQINKGNKSNSHHHSERKMKQFNYNFTFDNKLSISSQQKLDDAPIDKLNYDETRQEYQQYQEIQNVILKIKKNYKILTEINLQGFKLNYQNLNEILKYSLQCQLLQTLSLSVEEITDQNISNELEIKDQNSSKEQQCDKIVLSQHLKSIKLDFSKVQINIKQIISPLFSILDTNPENFQFFQILFNKNVESSIKLPNTIQIQNKNRYLGIYKIQPDFDTFDTEFKQKSIVFYDFNCQRFYRIQVEIGIEESQFYKPIKNTKNNQEVQESEEINLGKQQQIEIIKQKIYYLFSNIFLINQLRKMKLTIGKVNYDISRQIRLCLDERYKSIQKQLNISKFMIEIKDQQDASNQPLKELVQMSFLNNRKYGYSIHLILPYIDRQEILKSISFNFNHEKSKLFIKDFNSDNKELFLSLEKRNISLIYTKQDLFRQIQAFIKKENLKIQIQFQQNVLALQQQESRDTSQLVLNQSSSLSSQISQEQPELVQSKSNELEFKMIQQNFQIYVPYYTFKYEDQSDLGLSKMHVGINISNFTLPQFLYKFLFNLIQFFNFTFKLYSLDKFDYLQNFQVNKEDSECLQELEIDLSDQKLDLDLTKRIIQLFKESSDQILSFQLNLSKTISSYTQVEALQKFQEVTRMLSQWKNLEKLVLNLDQQQLDNSNMISLMIQSQRKLKDVELHIFQDIDELSKHDLLDSLENNQQIQNYKVQYNINAKKVEIIDNNSKLSFRQDKNSFIITNKYCFAKQSRMIVERLKFQREKEGIPEKILITFEQAEYVSRQFLQNIFESNEIGKQIEISFPQLYNFHSNIDYLISHFQSGLYTEFIIGMKDKKDKDLAYTKYQQLLADCIFKEKLKIKVYDN